MIPTRLSEWNLEAVRSVAASGIAENDLFDLKADLQPAEHQRKIVAAFANTRGGYLVFGVTNDRQVVGVSNDELLRDFGSKLSTGIEPSVEFRVGAAIPVSVGRNVFVVEVPRSTRVPHAVLQNGNWAFLKRSASGSNYPMSYEEIRLAFQETDMKRSKLALVASELDLIEAVAGRVLQGVPEDFESKNLYPINKWGHILLYDNVLALNRD
ncbi:MAG: ATP-binding protein [Nitrospira sp.]|nr:MAG: ATP-binding protein [Nitrospira sp.]